MRLHPAVPGAAEALRVAARQGARGARLPVQPVRRAGTGGREGDRRVLRAQLRRHLSPVQQGRRQRRRCCAALQMAQEGKAGPDGLRGDQVELHQVPRRSQGKGRRALCAERYTRVDEGRRGEAAVNHAFASLAIAAVLALSPGAARAQPDMSKVLRVSFPVAETGFDPQAAGDVYSNSVNRAIFDCLFKYDHLARPLKLVPNTAAAMPDISDDGKTWTIRVRPG